MKAGAHDYVMKDNLVRLCATVQRGLDEARRRRERRETAEELRRRDAILDAVRFAAERLLGQPGGWDESVRAVLRRLGEAAAVSRVYVFENFTGEDGRRWNAERHKWVAPAWSPACRPPPAASRSPASRTGRTAPGAGGILRAGRRFSGAGSRCTATRATSRRRSAVSRRGAWDTLHGPRADLRRGTVVGLYRVRRVRARARVVGGRDRGARGRGRHPGRAIRRRQVEEQLRASEERYRAVVEQATDGIYLLDAENRRLLETNPSFQEMLGYDAGEMLGMPVYDFVAHPRDDVDATIRRTLERGAGSSATGSTGAGTGRSWTWRSGST
jgi:PAS domain-containing protein